MKICYCPAAVKEVLNPGLSVRMPADAMTKKYLRGTDSESNIFCPIKALLASLLLLQLQILDQHWLESMRSFSPELIYTVKHIFGRWL